ncbi:MAG: dephospho-CoA kinase [Thermoanaerobaculia bacterium]|nr:dephospho-CoA kinase [Thermoanaerobaculia bacterium]
MIRRVGLTGGLAAGKSTVAEMLEERGLEVVDADRLVAELYGAGEEGARRVESLFGGDYLTESGAVDRPAVAGLVFDDPRSRRRLEEAIHPLVKRRYEEIVGETEGIVVLEASLLVEAGWAESFEAVVTVEAPPEIRLHRAMERGLSRDEAESRLDAQGSEEARRSVADFVLENDGSLEELERQVEDLVEALGASGS